MLAVSWLAVLTASVLPFALGYFWYGPLFGKPWLLATGLTTDRIKAEMNPARTYGVTFVLGVITAYAFGLGLGANPGLWRAVGAGFAVGLVAVAFSTAINDLFEFRRLRLTLINGGYHVGRFALIGLSFGLLG